MTKQPEELTALVSPDGKREWTPEDASQATDLRARGWVPKADPEPEKPAAKPATTPAK